MFGWQIIRVTGHSMEPTLPNEALVLIRPTSTYQVGDIVAVESSGQLLLKRISKIEQQIVWIVGDNPDDSLDSRQFGPVLVSQLRGKAVFW